MSVESKETFSVTLIGAGCASLSLAARADEFDGYEFTVLEHSTHQAEDHTWGFWAMPWLSHVKESTKKTWNNWQIISKDQIAELSSINHPYCAISRHSWLKQCRLRAEKFRIRFTTDLHEQTAQQIFDSRPPTPPANAMFQHFLGHEISTSYDVFNPNTAILMDFRCDQSLGMHFIYCLPFTKRSALIESTMFSAELAPKAFYEKAISQYLRKIFNCNNFVTTRTEQGVIPLAFGQQHDSEFTGIGANGGAIRPSSGYAFTFIHKQIDRMIRTARRGQPLQVKSPHSWFELFMDHVFLNVIRRQPKLAPTIFIGLAKALTGDEFALFLSGKAGLKLWLKVVFAMPKGPFLFALVASIR